MANNKKHLTEADRLHIEHWLRERMSIGAIALELGKSKSTISREIRARAIASDKYAPYRIRNRCSKRRECGKKYLCLDKPNCVKRCSTCSRCNGLCDDFVEEICQKLQSHPYVCNGCLDERTCVLRKKYYLHDKAYEAYRESLVESRVGVNITEDELLALDEFLSPLVMRGQSVHHVVTNNPDQFNVSEKSIYRYVNGGLLKARNIDMPRICRLKPRKSKPAVHKVDSGCRIERTYEDFLAFKAQSGLPEVQGDTVVGRIGGKVLLTLMFTACDVMLAFLRDRNTSQSVIDKIDMLYALLGEECFKEIIPALLFDNGSEFSNPKALEFDSEGRRRTRVFYCDPYSSFQKPNVELNHEFIRKILPKGTSFDNLSQGDIDLMMSHINSYSRKKLNNKSPHELFCFIYGAKGVEALRKLNITKIPANEILLKPSLLAKR